MSECRVGGWTYEGMPLVSEAVVYGVGESVRRAKLPMAADPQSVGRNLTRGVSRLALAPIGSGHDQWLTGVVVQLDLTLSAKAWVEAERYHFLDFVSSQSTMHRLAEMAEAGLEGCLDPRVDPRVAEVLREKVRAYREAPEEERAERYLDALYNVPSGFRLTAGMTTNYRQLKTIYAQRRDHMLPEWRELCKWMRTLPHPEWVAGEGA